MHLQLNQPKKLREYDAWKGTVRLASKLNEKYPSEFMRMRTSVAYELFDKYRNVLSKPELMKLKKPENLTEEELIKHGLSVIYAQFKENYQSNFFDVANHQIQYLKACEFIIPVISAKAQLENPLQKDQYSEFVSILKEILKNDTVELLVRGMESYIGSSLSFERLDKIRDKVGAVEFDKFVRSFSVESDDGLDIGSKIQLKMEEPSLKEHVAFHAAFFVNRIGAALLSRYQLPWYQTEYKYRY